VGYTYRHTDWWEEFMKYATEMVLGAMIFLYVSNLKKIGSAILKLMGWGSTAWRSPEPTFILLLFISKIWKVG
jgi:hypothetical protein